RAHRGEPDPAVAGDHGGDAVPGGGHHPLVPGGLAVVVGVDVDEAGRDQQAVGVDGAAPDAVDPAHLGDDAAGDGHVRGAGLGAGAVDDGAAADDEVVVAHGCAPWCTAGTTSVVSRRSARRAASRSARKVDPVTTNRSMPRAANPVSRSAQRSGGPTTANRSTKMGSSGSVWSARLSRWRVLS